MMYGKQTKNMEIQGFRRTRAICAFSYWNCKSSLIAVCLCPNTFRRLLNQDEKLFLFAVKEQHISAEQNCNFIITINVLKHYKIPKLSKPGNQNCNNLKHCQVFHNRGNPATSPLVSITVCSFLLVEFSLSPTFGITSSLGRFTPKHSVLLQNRLFSRSISLSASFTRIRTSTHRSVYILFAVAHSKGSLNKLHVSSSAVLTEKLGLYSDATLLCSQSSLCSCLFHQCMMGDEMSRGKSRCLGLECLLQPETILGWRGTNGLRRTCEGLKECGLNISNITILMLKLVVGCGLRFDTKSFMKDSA